MKKNLTELVCILDKSGSMASLTDDTIGGFNSLIKKQKDEEADYNFLFIIKKRHRYSIIISMSLYLKA